MVKRYNVLTIRAFPAKINGIEEILPEGSKCFMEYNGVHRYTLGEHLMNVQSKNLARKISSHLDLDIKNIDFFKYGRTRVIKNIN